MQVVQFKQKELTLDDMVFDFIRKYDAPCFRYRELRAQVLCTLDACQMTGRKAFVRRPILAKLKELAEMQQGELSSDLFAIYYKALEAV